MLFTYFNLKTFSSLIQDYIDVELHFSEHNISENLEKDDKLQELRLKYSDNLQLVVDMALAHNFHKNRNILVCKMLNYIKKLIMIENDQYKKLREGSIEQLLSLARLQNPKCAVVALQARLALLKFDHGYFEPIPNVINYIFNYQNANKKTKKLLLSSSPEMIHILSIIANREKYSNDIRTTAIDIYLKSIYILFSLKELNIDIYHVAENNVYFSKAEFYCYAQCNDFPQVSENFCPSLKSSKSKNSISLNKCISTNDDKNTTEQVLKINHDVGNTKSLKTNEKHSDMDSVILKNNTSLRSNSCKGLLLQCPNIVTLRQIFHKEVAFFFGNNDYPLPNIIHVFNL